MSSDNVNHQDRDGRCYCEKYYTSIIEAFKMVLAIRQRSDERLEELKLRVEEIKIEVEEAERDLANEIDTEESEGSESEFSEDGTDSGLETEVNIIV